MVCCCARLTRCELAAECPRIFSVESTLVRYKRLDPSNKNKKKKQKESFEVFASDTGSGEEMTTTYGFPTYLFSKSWSKSNGFAGSLRLPNGNSEWLLPLLVSACCTSDLNFQSAGSGCS